MVRKIISSIKKHTIHKIKKTIKRKKIKSIDSQEIENKTILLRVDYNVPIKEKKTKGKDTNKKKPYTIVDNTKIKESIKTIKYLLKKKCKRIIIISHLKNPKRHNDKFTLRPIAKELESLLFPKRKKLDNKKQSSKSKTKDPSRKVCFIEDCIGSKTKLQILQKEQQKVFLCENLRFYKEEYENDTAFAHALSDLADIYVNDAFAVSHRKHASIAKVATLIPSVAGLNLETETAHISRAIKARKPSVWVLGGAKLEKIELVSEALKKADIVLLGGALAFSFLKAKGFKVGHSLTSKESIAKAKKILTNKTAQKKIILPIDIKTTTQIPNKKTSQKTVTKTYPSTDIPSQVIGLDIGEKTIELFSYYIKQAKTVVINGPLGYTEKETFEKGSKKIYQLVAKQTKKHKCFSVAGGGETTQLIRKFKLQHKIGHVSNAGGALITMLSEKPMPGLKKLFK